MVTSIFSFRTMGQWEHWDSYTALHFCTGCNIVSIVGESRYLFIVEVAKLFRKTRTLQTPCESFRISESVSVHYSLWWKNWFLSSFHEGQMY